MAKHVIAQVSKDERFCLQEQDIEGVEYVRIPNNSERLATVYNMIVEGHRDADYVYLMHADVQLDVKGLVEHVESVAGKYDVIGLCGCSKINVSQTPLNWFVGSAPFQDSRWGCVTHGELGGETSFFNRMNPETTDSEVACIDGLCIILTRKAIESGLRFDEGLGMYDMYDTDISFQAVMKYGLKVGVVVRRDLSHFSVGKSILTEQFHETEKKFREKWGFPQVRNPKFDPEPVD